MFPSTKIHSSSPSEGGSILVAVLTLLALATFIALEFMEEATAKIKYYGLFYNRDDLRTEAYSVLETSLAVIDEIREIDRGLYSPVQGWGNPLTYAQIEMKSDLDIQVKIEDETAKISLSQATPLILNILFEEMGVSLSEAESLSDSLLDWIDTDDLTRLNGAEKDYYDRREHPYNPPNGPIQSWEELRLIKSFETLFFDESGIPNPYFYQFKGALSLHHHSTINLNSANNLVLAVVSRVEGYDTEPLNDYLDGDDGERGTEDDRLINSSSHPYYPSEIQQESSIAALQSQVLKVEVKVNRGEASFLLTAIVSWTGSNPGANAEERRQQSRLVRRGQTAPQTDTAAALGYPFQILRLTENFKI